MYVIRVVKERKKVKGRVCVLYMLVSSGWQGPGVNPHRVDDPCCPGCVVVWDPRAVQMTSKVRRSMKILLDHIVGRLWIA